MVRLWLYRIIVVGSRTVEAAWVDMRDQAGDEIECGAAPVA